MVEGCGLPIVRRDGQQQGKCEEDDDQEERRDCGTRGGCKHGHVNEVTEPFEGLQIEANGRTLTLSLGVLAGVVAQGGQAVKIDTGHARKNAQVLRLETVASATADLLLLRHGGGATEGVPAAVELALGVVMSAPGAADYASHAPPSCCAWVLGVGCPRNSGLCAAVFACFNAF
ncbi:Uncharacterised protein [Mycobacterium tuberculosis]|nr:Uncharacterised protein [Mycobacterium tuberculosis]